MFLSAVFLVSKFIILVYGLKLTLKQDMNKVQEQLSPREIGQFLHSINNLPNLAECVNPSNSRINFDFFFHYNNYGCADTKVFNWKRISKILSYGGLSKADKLILLNGRCLSQWPDYLNLQSFNLKYLLSVLPEINPILLLKEYQDDSLINIIIGDRARWNIFIEHAAVNGNLNFIPGINFLFKNQMIEPKDLENLPYFNIIGPEAVDSCYKNSRGQPYEASKCSDLVFFTQYYYQNLSIKEIFNWSLNIGIAIKYEIKARNILFMKGNFDKLIDSCPDEFVIRNFIKTFSSKMIYKHLNSSNENISNESILDIFTTLLMIQEDEDDEDYDVYLVELYKWMELNAEYFRIDNNYLNNLILKDIILKKISSKVKGNNSADYFLNFFIEKRQFSYKKYFKKFLSRNYDPSRPSHELILAFRRISWISGVDGGFNMMQSIKSFLNYDFRVSLVRKLSFSHVDDCKYSSTIDIFLGEDESIDTSMFNCIYDSLMNHDTLVYPLKVHVSTSEFLKDFIKESIDLKIVLQNFWNLLGKYSNGFMKSVDFEYSNSEDLLNYSQELIPNPWTHPNILLAIGSVMTLAFLNGIKLNGWRLKKTLFESIFMINSTSIYKSEEGRIIDESEYDNFLKFYTLNDYIKEIESSNDTRISGGLTDLINSYESLNPKTRRALYNYRNNLLKKNRHGYFNINTEYYQVWISKIFNFLEGGGGEDIDIRSSEKLLKALNPHLSGMNLRPESIKEDLDRITKSPSSSPSPLSAITTTSIISERDAARIQIYSLYLGLQPLTRFLNSNEVYSTIFKEE
jgi:hypothetical protein